MYAFPARTISALFCLIALSYSAVAIAAPQQKNRYTNQSGGE